MQYIDSNNHQNNLHSMCAKCLLSHLQHATFLLWIQAVITFSRHRDQKLMVVWIFPMPTCCFPFTNKNAAKTLKFEVWFKISCIKNCICYPAEMIVMSEKFSVLKKKGKKILERATSFFSVSSRRLCYISDSKLFLYNLHSSFCSSIYNIDCFLSFD